MITYTRQPKYFYLYAIAGHVTLVCAFIGWHHLFNWEPESAFVKGPRILAMVFIAALFGELGRRFDYLIFNHSIHQWLWSDDLFPQISKSHFWLLKLAQMFALLVSLVALPQLWDVLPLIIKGYWLFILGIVFFGGIDFMVCGYSKFLQRRRENTWLSNLRFRKSAPKGQYDPVTGKPKPQ